MAEVETSSFTRGEHTVVFDHYRNPGPGPVYVLLHGIGMGRAIYQDLAEELAKSGEVYALDLPGFGDSPAPGEALTIEQFGDIVADWVTSLDVENPVLVGHSMGAQVAAEALARHPEISNQCVFIAPAVNRSERTIGKQMLRLLQDFTGESPKVFIMGVYGYAKAGMRWFLKNAKYLLEHRLEETCPKITAEVLVIGGEKDRVCPRYWIEEVTDLLPNGRMEEIADRGHEAVISTPHPIAALIADFAKGA